MNGIPIGDIVYFYNAIAKARPAFNAPIWEAVTNRTPIQYGHLIRLSKE